VRRGTIAKRAEPLTSQSLPPAKPGERAMQGPQRAGALKQTGYSPDYLRLIRKACANADIVIAASPTPFGGCPKGSARLLRASELARLGTAEIQFISNNTELHPSFAVLASQALAAGDGQLPKRSTQSSSAAILKTAVGDAPLMTIRFAVGDPARPWNKERIFSRAARNMPEFLPVRRAARMLKPVLISAGRRQGPQ
jgi:hypothetical protein